MEAFAALVGFALVTSITPGPNNMMLMASGANWGWMRSIPHILGITVGFPLMLLAVGFGLGALFEAYPFVHKALKYIAFAYLLFLAFKLARAGRPRASGGRSGQPLSFLQAALFQWVNPKAWAMAVSALSLFGSPDAAGPGPLLALAAIFLVATVPAMSVWCLFGTAIARFLDSERRIAVFNGTMAVLLVLTMIPALL